MDETAESLLICQESEKTNQRMQQWHDLNPLENEVGATT